MAERLTREGIDKLIFNLSKKKTQENGGLQTGQLVSIRGEGLLLFGVVESYKDYTFVCRWQSKKKGEGRIPIGVVKTEQVCLRKAERKTYKNLTSARKKIREKVKSDLLYSKL